MPKKEKEMQEQEEKESLHVRIPSSLIQKLRMRSARSRKSMADIAAEIFDEALKNEKE